VFAGLGHLELTNIRLMVWHAQVLRPKLWRDGDWLAGPDCIFQHSLIQALRMQVDLDPAAARCYSLKAGLPKLVAAFIPPALAVCAKSHAANRGTCLQKKPQCIAAIGTMGRGR